jgi:hypothetical protein
MQVKGVTLRANYRRPVWDVVAPTSVVALLLLSGALAEPYMQVAVWALLVLGVLLMTMLIAAALSFIRLTPEGFSEPIHVMRVFNRWSEVSSFHVVDKKMFGIRISGVGFNYHRPYADLQKRRTLLDYDRVIDQRYGEPSELARVLNRWREASAASRSLHS